MAIAYNPSYDLGQAPAEADADIVLASAPPEVQEAAEHVRKETTRVLSARDAVGAELRRIKTEIDDEVVQFGHVTHDYDRQNMPVPEHIVARHKTKISVLRKRYSESQAQPVAGLSSWADCQDFLRRFKSGNRIVAAPSVALSNKPLPEQLKAAAQERTIIQDRLATKIRAMRPKDEVVPRIKRWVAAKAAEGTPRLGRSIRPTDLDLNGDFSIAAIGDPELPQTLDKAFESGEITTRDDPLAFMFWLNADQIESRLLALVDTVDFTGAMTADAKAKAVAAGQAELIACIRKQHAIHTALERQGTSTREGFWHPAIVLQIQFPPTKILADMPAIELRPRKK